MKWAYDLWTWDVVLVDEFGSQLYRVTNTFLEDMGGDPARREEIREMIQYELRLEVPPIPEYRERKVLPQISSEGVGFLGQLWQGVRPFWGDDVPGRD